MDLHVPWASLALFGAGAGGARGRWRRSLAGRQAMRRQDAVLAVREDW